MNISKYIIIIINQACREGIGSNCPGGAQVRQNSLNSNLIQNTQDGISYMYWIFWSNRRPHCLHWLPARQRIKFKILQMVARWPGRWLQSAEQFCLVAWNDLPVAARVSIARNSTSSKTLIIDQDIFVQNGKEVTIWNRFRTVYYGPRDDSRGALTKKVWITYTHTSSTELGNWIHNALEATYRMVKGQFLSLGKGEKLEQYR